MDFLLKIRLKSRDFFRKNGIYVIMAIFAVVIGIGVNRSLQNSNTENKNVNSINLTNNTPIIDSLNTVSKNTSTNDSIIKLLTDYMEYCNNKQYENAFEMLNNDFKDTYFKEYENYKKYIDAVFKKNKTYDIQYYSELNNMHIYNIKMTDDILASGTTGKYDYKEDKFVVVNENGEYKLAFNGYCKKDKIERIYEDNHIRINIEYRIALYSKETYQIQFVNKTSNYVIISDNNENSEITLNVSGDIKEKESKTDKIILLPNETSTKTISFNKYIDDRKNSSSLNFNTIRILPKYSGNEDNYKKELQNAIKLYSVNINL